MSSLRLFVAVDPSAENIAAFETTMSSLRKKAPRARWVRPEKLHVTLVFLGETKVEKIAPIEDAIRSVAENHAPFTLRFENTGTFGEKNRARVLWAGINGDLQALGALQNELARRLEPLGYTPEYRSFVPHLTLARSAAPRGDATLCECAKEIANISFGMTTIREVVLYQSETTPTGTVYTPLLRAPLRA